MEFFRITGRDQNGARLITEVEAQCMEDVLRKVDSQTTDFVEQLDPDSGDIFGSIHQDGRIWLNPATKEIRLTNCDVTIPIPIQHYGLLSRFAWFATEERDVITLINGNLVQMMELVENPWMANPLA